MKTENFIKLICELTGEPFTIDEPGEEVQINQLYFVRLKLAASAHFLEFEWKTPKDEENLLRSFVTCYTSKCRVVNPAHYVSENPRHDWNRMSQSDKDFARLCHHRANMFTKEELMKQVETRFQLPKMRAVFMRHGFYSTCYGVGIYCIFSSASLESAIGEMRGWLTRRGVGFTNEFSKAGWVYRFRLGLTRDIHSSILTQFSDQ